MLDETTPPPVGRARDRPRSWKARRVDPARGVSAGRRRPGFDI